MELTELAKEYHKLRQKKDEINSDLKSVNEKLSAIENEMVEDLHQAGLNRIDVAGLGSFTICTRSFFKVIDKEAFLEHLRQHDDEDILSVNHNTLNSYMKDWNERSSQEEVPGIDFMSKAQIRMRKSAK